MLIPGNEPSGHVRPSLGCSRIHKLNAEAHRLGAVDLSQGFSDEAPPAELMHFYREASLSSSAHQYAHPRGTHALRSSLSQKLEALNKLSAHPESEIGVTCGATGALMSTFRGLFRSGDQILAFAPLYENYFLMAEASGVRINTLLLSEPDFSFTEASLEAEVTPELRAVLICNPCNPTGKTFTLAELTSIVEFAHRHNLLIISDETYERFIWRGTHLSVASLPGAEERTVTVFSLGKTYSVTGWRLGYIVCKPRLLEPVMRVHELANVSVNHPCQLAVARALTLPESFYKKVHKQFAERKARLTEVISAAGFRPWEPAGGYFLWCDYSGLSSEPDNLFAERLLRSVGVAGVPGAAFVSEKSTNPQRMRLTFSKSLETIAEAGRRLARLDLLTSSKVS
jgi:aminotransferase